MVTFFLFFNEAFFTYFAYFTKSFLQLLQALFISRRNNIHTYIRNLSTSGLAGISEIALTLVRPVNRVICKITAKLHII